MLLEDETSNGLYVAAFFDEATQKNFSNWFTNNKIPNPVAVASLHTTIVYSRIPVKFEINHSVNVEVNTTYSKFEIWNTNYGSTLVLHYFSPYLHIRFQEAIAAGATYDHDEYKPHITLSFDVGMDFDITQLEPINFPVTITGEYGEVLDDEY